jgi:hypothetical protein
MSVAPAEHVSNVATLLPTSRRLARQIALTRMLAVVDDSELEGEISI